jgi:RES domain-containing protein
LDLLTTFSRRFPIEVGGPHDRFSKIPELKLQGPFFRGIPLRYVATPLSALGSKISGGRYNAIGAFEVFYLAPTPAVALSEVTAVASGAAPIRIAP